MKKNIKKNNIKKNNIKKNKKVTTIYDDFKSQNFIYIKKLKNIFIVILILFVLLVGRLAYLQFIDGKHLKELAYNQQSINQIISPKRGSIFDSTGKVLATSASVDTITINPSKISENLKNKKNTYENETVLKESLAKKFAEIFELNYDEVLQKINSSTQVETIAKKVEQDKVEVLKTWLKDNSISTGINIDEDTKRYYPYDNFLSQVIGSCGVDNQGLSGIENKWDSVLKGTPGKIVSSKSASQQEIPNAEESYIAAENGSDLTLTIDFRIQKIVEKNLKQAVDDNNVENGGSCIVMNPKNGDILAMATYPDYNLNTPFTPNEYLAKENTTLNSDQLFKMWSNKNVSELYEPGSVFKLITAATALEENITGTDVAGDFFCPGYEKVDGVTIKCWKDDGSHASQTLRQALENSCNPALMQLGTRIGTSKLYKYYKAFGFFDKTGVDLPGETSSIFKEESTVIPVERATYSFGQRFSITPLQMITAIASIANDGMLMKPRIVKSITNTDTGAVTTVNPEEVRQVISSSTASKVKSMMQSVVEDGTGRRASVTGYTVGGKTGTSEPRSGREDKDGYVATYVAISPVEDTQVVLLLNLYKPPKENHQGGTLAGPVVSQMLTEILPTLDIPSDEKVTDDADLITVPEIRNKTIAEAEKILKEKGFTSKITTNNDKNSTVILDQVPKPGVSLAKDSIIMLYDQTTRVSTTVPDLTGKSKYQATNELKNANLNISVTGSGTVISQDPPKGSSVDAGTVIKVTLKK